MNFEPSLQKLFSAFKQFQDSKQLNEKENNTLSSPRSKSKSNSRTTRKKRSLSQPHTIEVMVTADNTLAKAHADIEHYVLTLMAIVSFYIQYFKESNYYFCLFLNSIRSQAPRKQKLSAYSLRIMFFFIQLKFIPSSLFEIDFRTVEAAKKTIVQYISNFTSHLKKRVLNSYHITQYTEATAILRRSQNSCCNQCNNFS